MHAYLAGFLRDAGIREFGSLYARPQQMLFDDFETVRPVGDVFVSALREIGGYGINGGAGGTCVNAMLLDFLSAPRLQLLQQLRLHYDLSLPAIRMRYTEISTGS